MSNAIEAKASTSSGEASVNGATLSAETRSRGSVKRGGGVRNTVVVEDGRSLNAGGKYQTSMAIDSGRREHVRELAGTAQLGLLQELCQVLVRHRAVMRTEIGVPKDWCG